MDELLLKCSRILGLGETVSRREVEEAYERARQRCEAGAGAKGDPGPWERLKELAWARDILLSRLAPPEAPPTAEKEQPGPPPEGGQKAVLPSGAHVGESNSGARRWWLSSVVLGLVLCALLALLHLYGGSSQGKNVPQPQKAGGSPSPQEASEQSAPAGEATSPAAPDSGLLLQDVKKAVVTLKFGRKLGSGFFVTPDGFIVTNAHVVDATRGSAQLSGGDTIEVNLCSLDIDKDFALLKTAAGAGYSFLKLGDSSACREGDTVVAVGSPYSLQSTFTKGIVSAKDRRIPGFGATLIQTDAAINRGNSGGPLLNATGEVVGINAMGYEKALAEGLNFAVAINEVKGLIAEGQQLSENERIQQTARFEARLREQAQRGETQDAQARDAIINARKDEERRDTEYAEEMRKYLEKKQQRQDLDLCLGSVDRWVLQTWDRQCQALSLSPRCRLPQVTANEINGAYLKGQSECLSRYSP